MRGCHCPEGHEGALARDLHGRGHCGGLGSLTQRLGCQLGGVEVAIGHGGELLDRAVISAPPISPRSRRLSPRSRPSPPGRRDRSAASRSVRRPRRTGRSGAPGPRESGQTTRWPRRLPRIGRASRDGAEGARPHRVGRRTSWRRRSRRLACRNTLETDPKWRPRGGLRGPKTVGGVAGGSTGR